MNRWPIRTKRWPRFALGALAPWLCLFAGSSTETRSAQTEASGSLFATEGNSPSSPTTTPRSSAATENQSESLAQDDENDRPSDSNRFPSASSVLRSPQDAADLQTLTDQRKEILRRRRERFERLGASERERLRQLHQDLVVRDDAAKLEVVLVNYNRWLESLTSIQRAELADMRIDDRIAKIKEIKQIQEERAFRSLADSAVTREDIGHIGHWIRMMADRHEAEILERFEENRSQMGPGWNRFVPQAPNDPEARVRLLSFTMMSLPPTDLAQMLSDDDVGLLIKNLSEPAARVLQSDLPREDQIAQVGRWLAADFVSRMRAGISAEELERFFREELTDAARAELDQKSPQDRQERLRDLYIRRGFGRNSRRNSEGPIGPSRAPRRPERPMLEGGGDSETPRTEENGN